jgi:CheY-like chemotaxis protein
VTKPLALLFYENLLPGSQLVNRLQDLDYRVQVVTEASTLVECAASVKPLLVLADLNCRRANVCELIQALRQNPRTQHLPVLAFTGGADEKIQAAAREAGATLVAVANAMLVHLPQLLEQALEVE